MTKQSEDDLRQHLREQMGFLRFSGAAFDAGAPSEAKRLATAVRVLVHDTAQSTSLLGQLGIKTPSGSSIPRIPRLNLLGQGF